MHKFAVFVIELAYLIANKYFFICKKHSSLAMRIGTRVKTKFGRTDFKCVQWNKLVGQNIRTPLLKPYISRVCPQLYYAAWLPMRDTFENAGHHLVSNSELIVLKSSESIESVSTPGYCGPYSSSKHQHNDKKSILIYFSIEKKASKTNLKLRSMTNK